MLVAASLAGTHLNLLEGPVGLGDVQLVVAFSHPFARTYVTQDVFTTVPIDVHGDAVVPVNLVKVENVGRVQVRDVIEDPLSVIETKGRLVDLLVPRHPERRPAVAPLRPGW